MLPGVQSASAAASLPLTGDNLQASVEVEGQPTPQGSRHMADFDAVEPKYFGTVGISLLKGRDFTQLDDAKSTPVVVVNRSFVRRFFPNQNPIGKHIRPGVGNGFSSGEPPMREIIGIIADVKQNGLREDVVPEVYAPLAQSPFDSVFLAVRMKNDPGSIVAAAARQIASLDKHVPIYHVRMLQNYYAASISKPRFSLSYSVASLLWAYSWRAWASMA